MSPDAMTARFHLRRIRVLEVLVDLVEELVVAIGGPASSRASPLLWVHHSVGA